MSNHSPKERFLRRLRFWLAFSFGEEEQADIIGDYTEWFENEQLAGKSQEVICAALHTPRVVAEHLRQEAGRGFFQPGILLKQAALRALGLFFVGLGLGGAALRACNQSGRSCFYPLLWLVLLYFLMGPVLLPGQMVPGRAGGTRLFRGHLLAAGLSAGTILAQLLLLPRLTHPQSGAWCVLVLDTLLLGLVCMQVFILLRLPAAGAFLLSLHLFGGMAVLAYTHNQLHLLYGSIWHLVEMLAYGSACLYLAALLPCLVLLFRGRKG